MYEIKIEGIIGEDFTVNNLAEKLQISENEQNIKILINSKGGYLNQGLTMYNMLVDLKKNIFTQNTGDVASAAVPIFLAAPLENRMFNNDLGVFLIHNTWIDNKSGTAADLEATAIEMKKSEKELISLFSKTTGSNPVLIKTLMDEDKPLTSSQIEIFKFSKLININMDKSILNKIGDLLKQISGTSEIVAEKPIIKNFFLQDVTGQELEFPETITSPDQIVVGITAKLNGKEAEGSFILVDGRTLVIEKGIVTSIMPSVNPEMEDLKKENTGLQNRIKELETKLNTINSDMKNLKNLFNEGSKIPENTPEQKPVEVRKSLFIKNK